MHEAGLAQAVAGTLRERGLSIRDVRLLVRDGHGAPDTFDASLRARLALALPCLDDDVEIVHLATPRICAACGTVFEAADPANACPDCGGTSLPAHGHEEIEIELR